MAASSLLVTGAAGFIGYRFIDSVLNPVLSSGLAPQEGAPAWRSIVAVDRLSHFSSRFEHQTLRGHSAVLAALPEIEKVDRDELFTWLSSASNRARISAVVHLGACANTMETDESFFRRVNVEYSQKLWNFATERQIPFVYASSAATYGDGARGYADEEKDLERLKPLNAYGWSKHLFDLWALAEERAGRHPSSWAGFKFFNVYGFGERHKGSMASVVLHAYDQIRKTGGVKLFRSHKEGIADGHQKRDFIAVEDVIKVLAFAIEKPIERGIFNLGTGHARSYLELAETCLQAMALSGAKIEFIDTPPQIRSKYQYFTQAVMDRLRAEGYAEPFCSLEDGINSYVARLSQK